MVILSHTISIFSEPYNFHCYHEPSSVMAFSTDRPDLQRKATAKYFSCAGVPLTTLFLILDKWCILWLSCIQFCSVDPLQCVHLWIFSLLHSLLAFFPHLEWIITFSILLGAPSFVVLARVSKLVFQQSVHTLINSPLPNFIVQLPWSSTIRTQFHVNSWSSCQSMLAQSCNFLG